MTPGLVACPACKASPISGRYCRRCGVPLHPDPGPPHATPQQAESVMRPAPLGAPDEPTQPTMPTVSGFASQQAGRRPPSPPAPSAPPQPAPTPEQRAPAAGQQTYFAPNGYPNGWTPNGWTPIAVPPSPPPYWLPSPAQGPAPQGHSNLPAVAATLAIILLLLAIAATVIVLVASGGSNHTGILTQSSATGNKIEQAAAP